MSEANQTAALEKRQALFGELAIVLRQAVPKLRELEDQAFSNLPPEMEELDDEAPYPETVRRGLDLVAAERLSSLVALLEALAGASPANPDPDESEIAEVWRSLDPSAPPLPPLVPQFEGGIAGSEESGRFESLLAELAAQPDEASLTATLDRLELEKAQLRDRSAVPPTREDDELLARTRAAFSKILKKYPKRRIHTPEETAEWLARSPAERWAEVRTAPLPHHSLLLEVLEHGAQHHRSAAERRDFALWAIACLAGQDPTPEPRGLWIDLQARAWSLLALSALETGETRRADFAIEEAWVHLERGSGDPSLLFVVAIPAFLLDWKVGRSKALTPAALRLFSRALRDRSLEGELCLWQALHDEAHGHLARAEQSRRATFARLGREAARERERSLRQLAQRLGIPLRGAAAQETPPVAHSFEVH